MACRHVKHGSRHPSVLHSERRSNQARTLTLSHQARHASGTEEGHFEQNTRWPSRHRQVQSISQVFCVMAGTISTDSVHGRELCRMDLVDSRGQQNILVVDYFLRNIELAHLQSSTASETAIVHCKSIFARHGIPEVSSWTMDRNLYSINLSDLRRAADLPRKPTVPITRKQMERLSEQNRR